MLHFNKKAEEILGYRAEEIIGKETPAIWHDHAEVVVRAKELSAELGERIESGFNTFTAKVIRDGYEEREWIYIRKDGSHFTAHVSLKAFKDSGQNIVGYVGVAEDVTERKQADQAKGFLAAIVESSADAVIAQSIDGRINAWNKAAETIFGYSAEDAIGQPISLIIPKDHMDEERDIIAQLYSGKNIGHFETIRRRKNGEHFNVSLSISLIYDAKGHITGTSKVARDITYRKDAEKLLKEANDFSELITESNPDLIFVKDADFRIVKANKAFLRVYPEEVRDSVIGTTTLEKYNKTEADIFLAHDIKAFEDGMSEAYEDIMFPDGQQRHIVTKKVRFTNAVGEPFILGISRDISELKRADAYRKNLMNQLTESNMNLERFAYVASHDMQEPLRMIANFTALIAEEYAAKLDETGKEYIALVKNAAERMQAMVIDLLDYSRVKNNQAWITKEVAAPLELQRALENLTCSIAESRAVVTYDLLPHFYGNPFQFMRLLQNLIGNGLKYQHPETIPRIHIGVTDEDTYWCFSVKDNGIGIHTDFVDLVFEPFKRLHTWDDYKGSGIGLAVCKQIVEMHQGKIWVHSKIGEGSIFYFTIIKNNNNTLNKKVAA